MSARRVAFDVLRQVTGEDAYANLALAKRLAVAGLDARDAALVTELVAGDEDMAEYVAGLASRYEAEAQAEAGEEHGEALVEEVERFLREQRRRE